MHNIYHSSKPQQHLQRLPRRRNSPFTALTHSQLLQCHIVLRHVSLICIHANSAQRRASLSGFPSTPWSQPGVFPFSTPVLDLHYIKHGIQHPHSSLTFTEFRLLVSHSLALPCFPRRTKTTKNVNLLGFEPSTPTNRGYNSLVAPNSAVELTNYLSGITINIETVSAGPSRRVLYPGWHTPASSVSPPLTASQARSPSLHLDNSTTSVSVLRSTDLI